MINQKKAANAIGGNTARACDSCLVKRARWFCVADDAFLCQRCDSTVHSANQLASRHERVRLQGASSKANGTGQLAAEGQSPPASWHHGFTRKARTPRPNNKAAVQQSAKNDQEKVVFRPPLPFVPEIGCDEPNYFDDEENEDLEQLLYRVPIYDPFAAELCNLSTGDTNVLDAEVVEIRMENNSEVGGDDADNHELGNLQGFLPSDMELAEFAADVENLLGGGLDEDSSDMKGVLGLLDDDGKLEEDGELDVCMKAVKVEGEEGGMEFNPSMLDWSLDYDESSPVLFGGEEDEEEKVVVLLGGEEEQKEEMMMKRRKIFLRLNHEAVIAAWGSQGGSPWTTGTRPEFNPDDAWLNCMGMWPIEVHQGHGHGSGGCARGDDRGREARVSRYREKRRTRLFSKKIRYEVRKLNAEKRPRMKGRFVKRTNASNFVGGGGGSGSSSTSNAASFPYLVNK